MNFLCPGQAAAKNRKGKAVKLCPFHVYRVVMGYQKLI